MSRLFDLPSDGSDARTIGAEWAESTRNLSEELGKLLAQKVQYQFVVALEPFATKIAAMVGKPTIWYITEPAKHEDDLLDTKEEVLDKIRSFMGGAQREIYDDARSFLSDQETNIPYVDLAAGDALKQALADPNCYKGTAIQSLKSDLYALKDRVDLAVLNERKAVVAEIDECATKITQMPDFQKLSSENQAYIKSVIEDQKAGLDGIKMIPFLRDRANSTKRDLLPRVLAELDRLNKPKPSAPTSPDPTPNPNPGMAEDPAPAFTPEPVKQPAYVNASEIKVSFAKAYLAEEADVEQYVAEMKKTLLDQIRSGNKVIV